MGVGDMTKKKKSKYEISEFFSSRIDFDDKKIQHNVMGFMKRFYSDNIVSLSSDGFTKRIIFGNMKRNELISIYGVSESEYEHFTMNDDLLKYLQNVQDILNVELLMHYYHTKDVSYLKFLSIKLFTWRFFKSFPKYLDEPKMRALINSLSNKFYIKKMGSLDKALDKTIETFLRTYRDRLNDYTDANIIYLVNGLATRVNALVKYIRNRYYDYKGTIYDDVEILDRENMRTTTNDTARYDGIVNQTINTESVNRIDLVSFKQSGGVFADKKIFDAIYRKNFMNVRNLIKTLVNNFVKDNPKVSINDAQNLMIQYIMSNRTNSADIDRLLNDCFTNIDVSNTKKDELKRLLKKYIAIRIFRTFLKQVA